MDFKYVKNLTEDSADMLLYNSIGGSGISGSQFANEIQYLNKYNRSLKNINLRINSPGGSVFDGYSIIGAMNSSAIPINVYIEGLAASMGAVIAVNGKKVSMTDYSTMMVHDPIPPEGEQTEKDKEILQMFKKSICKLLACKVGMDEEKMSEMMKNETWMDCMKAKKNGFVDEVVKTGKRMGMKIENSTPQELFLYYNSIVKEEKPEPKTNKMKKINALLKLQEDASEDSALAALTSISNELSTSKATADQLLKERDALKVKVDGYEAKEKEVRSAEIKTLVENAVKEGKITEASKEAWVKNATTDFDSVKTAFEGMSKSKQAVKIADKAGKASADKGKGGEDRDSWTIRDWEKKDAKGLAKIQNETPEIYKEMYDAHYKKEK